MKNGRREFLRAAGLAPAAAVTGLAATAAHAAPVVGELRRSHFAPLAGERFEFEQDVFEKVGARLAHVAPLPRAADGERSFRLLFEAEDGKRLAQGSWRVTHPALGTQVVFLSPNDAEGRVAEAVFNRL
jgi:hypothetical protein